MQEVNFVELEEKYGAELAEKISGHVKYCEEKNHSYKFETIDESERFITFAFASRGYSYVYEISKRRKGIMSEAFIGWREANAVAKLMNSIE